MENKEKLEFRNLTKDEIEVRVGGGNNLLLYKTARVDAKVLDETVGVFNWQKRFYQVKNTMICAISINVNYKNPELPPVWVEKADAGDDDYTMEKVKAEASDSFKRAGFAWGIGRNLYTAPKIKLDDNFKGKQFFDVEEIGYAEDGTITDLVISTDFGKTIVFSFKSGRKVAQTGQNAPQNKPQAKPQEDLSQVGKGEPVGSIETHDLTIIQNYAEALPSADSKERFYAWIDKTFKTMALVKLTKSQGKAIIKRLGLEKM